MEAVMDKIGTEKYPAYKDSGVEWLEKVPEHWEIKPGFTVVEERKEKNVGLKEKTVLSLSYGNVIVKPEEKLTGLVPESFETYQLVYPGDIIIRPTDLQNDKTSLRTGLAKNKGIITSAYINLKVKEAYNSKFFHYFLHTIDLNKIIYGLGSGLRQNLDYNDFKRFRFLCPPIKEQTAIAAFLDRKTAQIDKAIAQKEKLIELLKEHRQILIHKAVTRGLDPNAKMKDSGVEWIGEIPEHWGIRKLRQCLKSTLTIKNKADLPLLSITREKGIIERDIHDQEENHNFIPEDLSNYKLIQKGQFGMNKMKAWQGSYGVSAFTGIVSPAYFVFELDSQLNSDFFHLAIRSNIYVSFFAQASDGVRIGQWDLQKSRMKDIPFITPTPSEQVQILELVDKINKKVKIAIDSKEKEIEKLQEYKATLINAAVTGKIKVC